MRIRNATINDLEKLLFITLEFGKLGWTSLPYKFDKKLIDTLRSWIKEGIVLLGEENDTIVGFICGQIMPSAFHSTQLIGVEYIWYVRKKKKGLNLLGIKLMKKFIEEVKRKGASLVLFTNVANVNNEYMQKLYAKKGFILVENQYIKEV